MRQHTQSSRFRWLLAGSILALAALYIARYTQLVLAGQALPGHDFEVTWRGVQATAAWRSPYSVTEGYFTFLNPPFYMFLLWPLHYLPRESARVAWYALQLALWVAVLTSRPVRRLWPHVSSGPRVHYMVFALVISFPFILITVLAGQIAILIAASLLFGMALLPTRPLLAGAVLSIACVKPQLAALVPFMLLAGKDFRAFAAFAGAVLFLCAASTLAFGADIWTEYLHALAHGFSEGSPLNAPEIPQKFHPLLISIYGAARMLGADKSLALIAQFFMSMMAIAATFWVTRRAEYGERLSIFFLSSFFISGYVMFYDTVILSAAVLLRLERMEQYGASAAERLRIVLLALLCLITTPFALRGIPAATLILLACWAGWLTMLCRKPAAT